MSAKPAGISLHRSYLYAPGSNARLLDKAVDAGADAVIFDLEDAVAPADKLEARRNVAERITRSAREVDVHVRVNRGADGFMTDDVVAVVQPGLGALRLPKVEAAAHVRDLADELDDLEAAAGMVPGGVRLYLTVETALGAVRLPDLVTASDRVARVAFGATDFLADIGSSGDDDLATLHARSSIVLTSRAAGLAPPVDSVHTRLDDVDGLRRACRRARALGFFGKSIIHPRQLDVVHEVFTPTDREVAWARGVVQALKDAGAAGSGATAIDGEFIDAAVEARARGLLALQKGIR